MKLRALGSGPIIGSLLIGLIISIAWAATSPVNDAYSTTNSQWNGTSMLLARGFKPVQSDLGTALSTPTAPSALFIIGPSRQFTTTEADTITAYVADGGMLILADNFGSGNSLLELMGLPIRFDGRLLVDTLFYTKQPTSPTIVDLPQSGLLNGVNELAMNYATALNITNDKSVRILATSTPFSFLATNQNGARNPGEPSGPFPVLAEQSIGKGSVIVFTSPASFTNGMLNIADNSIFLQNIVKSAAEGSLLLDQTHLTPSPFTPAKEAAQQMVQAALNGGMPGSMELTLTALATCIVAVRYAYRKPEKEEVRVGDGVQLAGTADIDSILQMHPTWSREKLEYVKRELDVTQKWRRLRAEEE